MFALTVIMIAFTGLIMLVIIIIAPFAGSSQLLAQLILYPKSSSKFAGTVSLGWRYLMCQMVAKI